MNELDIAAVVDAYGWKPGRPVDRSWLAPGFEQTLLILLERYPDTSVATLWAVALLLGIIERGGTCLPLADIANVEGYSELPGSLQDLTADEWYEQLRGEAFASSEGEVRPLVMAHGRLYFDRYFQAERRIATELLRPLDPDALQRPTRWEMVCDEIFSDTDESNPSRHMASALWSHRVYLLAGGPGTGKTTAVARFLVSLVRASSETPDVRLCAPTGKAAQRMGAAIAAAVHDVDSELSDHVRTLFTPVTIHALLGISPATNRRRSNRPLDVDFIICDETSMVDVVLLGELLSALPSTCRVLLVGDPHQLQSVDVGSVMGDLVDLAEQGVLPATQLERTYRINEEMADADRRRLLSFFSSIRSGRPVDATLAMLDLGDDVLSMIDVGNADQLIRDTESAWSLVIDRARWLRSIAVDDPTPASIDTALNSVMVLTAQHEGPLSRSWWVERVGGAMKMSIHAHPVEVGTPILITQTDRANGLTNGDVGLLVNNDGSILFQPSAAGSDAPSLRPTAIQHWQPWWAMTIHKSQGSEFQTVIVSITPHSHLISRELIYTAVTRARRRVILVGRRDDIRTALSRSVHRYSGLVDVALDLYRAVGARPIRG